MGKRLDPAEKVARAAARIMDALGPETVEQARQINANVKGVGGRHYITHARVIALAEAVEAWRSKSE